MVERLRDHYQIRDSKVLDAMRSVPRHAFVPDALQSRAYGDHALPISGSQTISQPYIVARMLEAAAMCSTDRLLEVLGSPLRPRDGQDLGRAAGD